MATQETAITTAAGKREVVQVVKDSVQEFAKRLPANVDPTKWTMQLATVIQKNNDLLKCKPGSLLLAAYEAAEVGINLTPSLQLGYIIPYGESAQFQIGYRGMIQKARQTEEVAALFAEVVYSKDQFSRQYAPKRNLFHAPPDGERGEKIGAYAFIEFRDGTVDWEFMTNEQIERRKNHSRNKNSLMWTTFWEEGWRKTPIRALFKRIPLTSTGMEKLAELINKDAEADFDAPAGRIELEPDSPLANAPAREDKEEKKPAAETEKRVEIFLQIGKKETSVSGDVRGIVKELPKLGAKLQKDQGAWFMPSGRAHELIKLLDDKGIKWAEVDAEGKIVGQQEIPAAPAAEQSGDSLFDDR